MMQEKYDELLREPDPSFDLLPSDKQTAQLRLENKTVREELKRLNRLLSELLEFRRNCRCRSMIYPF